MNHSRRLSLSLTDSKHTTERESVTLFVVLCVFPAAVAEVGHSPGAPGLSLLPGLGDGSGRDGLLPNAGHQPL